MALRHGRNDRCANDGLILRCGSGGMTPKTGLRMGLVPLTVQTAWGANAIALLVLVHVQIGALMRDTEQNMSSSYPRI